MTSLLLPPRPADDCRTKIHLYDHARRVDCLIRLTERLDHPFATSFARSEVHEQHLIVGMVDDF